ncbi:alpha/beta hydrolase [Variovorax rhizosphaerae]|uniref:Alpha/beta hydrolase n=1 Tax=Variovorax rhizosphaerae TaxID=1836200 RepID=A0ABU8WP83_9BURK
MSLIVQGVDVFVSDTGQGEPILFLHGNPDSAEVWSGVIARLQDRFRCIAIDLPGFGRSKAPDDFDYSVENLGRFVNGVLEGLGIDGPIHLVAHDFGGAFATSFAIAHPDRIRRLVVINHMFYIADYKWHFWARIWRTPLIGELSMRTMTWPTFRWSLRLGSKRLSDEQIRHAWGFFTPTVRRNVLKLYRAVGPAEFKAWEPRMRVATAKIPTLVMWGLHDPYIPAWIAQRFGTTQVASFQESGHWAPAEVPELVSAELLKFLRP